MFVNQGCKAALIKRPGNNVLWVGPQPHIVGDNLNDVADKLIDWATGGGGTIQAPAGSSRYSRGTSLLEKRDAAMTGTNGIVFLFDVDNTLLDNDKVRSDLSEHLEKSYGATARDRYWTIFETLTEKLGYSDYLGALELYRLEDLHSPALLRMANWMVDYPFADRLYPHARDVVRHARQWGRPVILSDGDAVFQPRKIERSGLWQLFEDRVLIYIHKEEELDDVERFFPARHYVMIDDKLRILTEIKKIWGERVTTVFPRQGHYANDPEIVSAYPSADIQIDKRCLSCA